MEGGGGSWAPWNIPCTQHIKKVVFFLLGQD